MSLDRFDAARLAGIRNRQFAKAILLLVL